MSTDYKGPLMLSVSLAAKLGSILTHAEEYFSNGGHDFDKTALLDVLSNAEVKDWLGALDQMALLPKKRN